MPRKKKTSIPVNIDARVSKRIKTKKIPKVPRGKRPAPYSKKEVKEFIRKRDKGKVEVLSDSEYKKASEARKDKAFAYSEAERQYLEVRQDWYDRYRRIEGTGHKKKIPSEKTDWKTGEKKYIERSRTVYRWRDRRTGKFVSYDGKQYKRDKKTGELKEVPRKVPLKGMSVKESRKEMRKETAIYKMAEKKRISIQDARKLYDEFEDRGMDRYILKEYARTP